MPVKMITAAELAKFAPHAKAEHVKAILDNEGAMSGAGILDSALTLCHFMGQLGAESNYFQIVREDMNYTSVRRIRQVWPARMRKYSDQWISSNLVRNPRALANLVYNGRMGNRSGTDDGFLHIGGGALQCTGRYMTEKFCRDLDIPYSPEVLNDCAITFKFACMEWDRAGCNPYAKANDLLAVSKIINVGSAKSGVMPNGMENRRAAFKKAWQIWGDNRRTIPDATGVTASDLKKAGSETIRIADGLKAASVFGAVASGLTGAAKNTPPEALPIAPPAVTPLDPSLLDNMRTATETTDLVAGLVTSLKAAATVLTANLWIFGLVCGVAGFVFAKNIIQRRVSDARLGLNTARVAEGGDGVPA